MLIAELLYNRLSKASSGCTIADLQFALPAVPVNRIRDVLAEVGLSSSAAFGVWSRKSHVGSHCHVYFWEQLQMDGAVYESNAKYLLL